MSEDRPSQSTLFQLPDFDFVVTGY
jgi:hypothetical protein